MRVRPITFLALIALTTTSDANSGETCWKGECGATPTSSQRHFTHCIPPASAFTKGHQ